MIKIYLCIHFYCKFVIVDWYPQHVNTEQNGTTVAVTFNLAPQNLGIRSYFSVCYTDGVKRQTSKVDITPVRLLLSIVCIFD